MQTVLQAALCVDGGKSHIVYAYIICTLGRTRGLYRARGLAPLALPPRLLQVTVRYHPLCGGVGTPHVRRRAGPAPSA